MKTTNSFESAIRTKSYLWQSFIVAFILVFGFTFIRYFVPDFLHNSSESFAHAMGGFFFQSTKARFGFGITYICLDAILWSLNFIAAWVFIRYFFNYLTFNKWYPHYIDECTKIINSCDPFQYKDRVAIIIPICNDISEHTILQTASQTYKCDVWLCDDSSNEEAIRKIDAFAKQHNLFVIHRSAEHKKNHPSKIGNIYYFLDFHGNEYDYVLETDSSSIVTNTFVENALRFFHSPLIDTNKLSAMVCNGSFYPTNNLFSWINSKQSQWTEAHMLNSSMRMGGSHVSYQGWGTIIKVSVLKQIPLEAVECSMCDIARGFYISRHGWTCYFDPFDFSGKIAQQNMYRWKNQRMKWAGGDAFIYKHLVCGRKFDDPYKTIFIRFWSFCTTITVPITTICQLILWIVSCVANFGMSFNLSSIFVLIMVGVALLIPLIIVVIKWRVRILSLIYVVVSLIFEFGILFRRTYQILIYGLICGKWSSAKVTIKSKETLSFGQWLRSTLFDWCWIIGSLLVCLTITLCTNKANLDRSIIWAGLFMFLITPSILFIVASLFSYVKIKEGWNNDTVWYDIAGNDFRFKYIKETEVWKKQHPVSK